jgi:hypothetical protein
MDFFAAYATNPDAENEGRYFENGDAEFLIARGGNDRYSRMIAKQYEANKHLLDDKSSEAAKTAGEELAKKITIDVMSKSILLGWKGNVLWQGKPLPYTVDNAQMLLGLKDFQTWVAGKSNAYQNFLLSAEAEDAKNSETTSSGTSSGEVASATST